MATSNKLHVMISSRCDDFFPLGGRTTTLSKIRRELKSEIERIEIFGRKFFEAWINEETPPKGGTWDSWDVCIEAVKNCDILLVISNGNAGWARSAGEIGICHAELMTGLSISPGKVRLIALENIPITSDASGARNKRFQDFVTNQTLFRGGAVNSEFDLKASPSFLVTNLTRGKCALQRRFSFPQPYPKSSNYFLGALTEESRSIVLAAERFCLGLSAVAAVFSPVLAGRS